MNTYDVGDYAPLQLEVAPADESTGVYVVAVDPLGVAHELVARPSSGGAFWRATLELAVSGLWAVTWTVTGTGAGVEHHLVSVRPRPHGHQEAPGA